MEMTGFCGEQKPVFCGCFSFLENRCISALDNPPEMCYTKSIPKPFVSGTEIQKVRNVM